MALPPDIDPESRSRLPLVRREELDEASQAIYDRAANDSRSLVGLRGPGGIRLHNPTLTALSQPLNRYLRFEAGLDRRVAEVTILATARELDQAFEWCAHEAEAANVGVDGRTIDVIRRREPLEGLDDDYAAMIALVREAVGEHRVSTATFERALTRFGKVPLLNYVALIGNYMATAVLLTVFDQQLPEGKHSTL